jgi:hypothetical protein
VLAIASDYVSESKNEPETECLEFIKILEEAGAKK